MTVNPLNFPVDPADLGSAAGSVVSGLLPDLAAVGRVLLVVLGTGALLTLGVVLIAAGLLNLLGFSAGDVARLTPPGRAATIAELAVSKKG